MRILMNIKFPLQPFNDMVKAGTVGAKIKKILDELKPESAYFTEQDGGRGAVIVVDIADSTKLPTFAEPWFLTFDAKVEFRIAMSPEDLSKTGLDKIGKKWG
jgi:hypothetical protein